MNRDKSPPIRERTSEKLLERGVASIRSGLRSPSRTEGRDGDHVF